MKEQHYVRWHPRRPRRNERSRNHLTGAIEVGLSVVAVSSDSTRALALAVSEWATLGFPGARCWLVTGREVGRGSEGEPVITGVRVIREIAGPELDRLFVANS